MKQGFITLILFMIINTSVFAQSLLTEVPVQKAPVPSMPMDEICRIEKDRYFAFIPETNRLIIPEMYLEKIQNKEQIFKPLMTKIILKFQKPYTTNLYSIVNIGNDQPIPVSYIVEKEKITVIDKKTFKFMDDAPQTDFLTILLPVDRSQVFNNRIQLEVRKSTITETHKVCIHEQDCDVCNLNIELVKGMFQYQTSTYQEEDRKKIKLSITENNIPLKIITNGDGTNNFDLAKTLTTKDKPESFVVEFVPVDDQVQVGNFLIVANYGDNQDLYQELNVLVKGQAFEQYVQIRDQSTVAETMKKIAGVNPDSLRSSGTCKFEIRSNVHKDAVTINNKHYESTPVEFIASKNQQYMVAVSKDGYQTQTSILSCEKDPVTVKFLLPTSR
ncbi:MAG: PEGA domain-containing protein [SAR324 cluster bacterium]|nr:PEGA domain-containing protein [SAR324 cluster bacterium]